MKFEAAHALVLCAHPDDEVLGCGGTIARLAGQGSKVEVCFLADGVSSRGTQALSDGSLDDRRARAHQAAGILGIGQLHFLDFPDNRLDTIGLLELAQAVEQLVGDKRPDLVLTHSPTDLNVDHRQCAAVAMTVFRPDSSGRPALILGFETPSSTEWNTAALHGSFKPDLYVAVADQLDSKIAALAAYDSEMRASPHPRSEAYVRALATVRGGAAGVASAEAFTLLRGVL
jgi:LmbE family N-acetylglucosaminyl deacetylase